MAKRKNGARKPTPEPNGHRIMKRYSLPDYCDVATLVMRELDGTDEIEAAIWADKNKSSALASSPIAAMESEQRESIRLSLVEVDGEPVNVGGIPYAAMNDWSYRTMRFVNQFFLDLNGVEISEVKNAVAAGEIISNPSQDPEDVEDDDQPTGA